MKTRALARVILSATAILMCLGPAQSQEKEEKRSARALEVERLNEIRPLLAQPDKPNFLNARTKIERLLTEIKDAYTVAEKMHADGSIKCAATEANAQYIETTSKTATEIDNGLKTMTANARASLDKMRSDAAALRDGVEKYRKVQISQELTSDHAEMLLLVDRISLEAAAFIRINESYQGLMRSCTKPTTTTETTPRKRVREPPPQVTQPNTDAAPQGQLLCIGSHPTQTAYVALKGGPVQSILAAGPTLRLMGQVGGRLCVDFRPFVQGQCPGEQDQDLYRCRNQ